jgi:hypothetical protein
MDSWYSLGAAEITELHYYDIYRNNPIEKSVGKTHMSSMNKLNKLGNLTKVRKMCIGPRGQDCLEAHYQKKKEDLSADRAVFFLYYPFLFGFYPMDFQGEQQHSHSLKTSDVYVQLY